MYLKIMLLFLYNDKKYTQILLLCQGDFYTKCCVIVYSRKTRKSGLDWICTFSLHIITQKSTRHHQRV
jgi:hypothetical protein